MRRKCERLRAEGLKALARIQATLESTGDLRSLDVSEAKAPLGEGGARQRRSK